MPDLRGFRFAFEVALLVALAVVLGLAGVRPLAIVGVMSLAWLVVALVEWIAWRDVPHYASGSPPRYYVPPVDLPPPHPVEQLEAGSYPRQRAAEPPTWIAPAELRADVVGEWPVPAPPPPAPVAAPVPAVDEEPELAPPEFAPAGAADDPWRVEALPAEPVSLGPVRLAVHHLEPFAEAPPRRRPWQRRLPESGPVVELPAVPRHPRLRRSEREA